MKPLTLSESEKMIIERIKADGSKGWDNKEFAPIKRKIKDHYRSTLLEQCCYCRKNTHGEFNMVLDVEHILPKSNLNFIGFMYELLNLSVACKRCNLDIKNDDISFLADLNETIKTPFISSNYKFIHPNLDNYFDHLDYYVIIKNNKKLIKYSPVNSSSKGIYTYNYFQLSQLEIDSLNENQGISKSPLISPAIEEDLVKKIDTTINKSDQNFYTTQQSQKSPFSDLPQYKAATFPHVETPFLTKSIVRKTTCKSLEIESDQKDTPVLNLPKPSSKNDKE